MLHVTAYHTTGADETLAPLVILHGMFGAGDNWVTIAKELGRERRVYTIDLPGHGESDFDQGERPFHYRNLETVVAHTLENALQGTPVVLCGHSMGGKVAMAVALVHPGFVERLIVVDTAPRSYLGDGFNSEVLEMLRAIRPETLENRMELDGLMRPYIEDPVMRGFMLKSLLPREGGGYRWRFAADVILEGAADIADWPEVLPRGSSDEGPLRYHGPVLVIRGELSPYVEPDRDMPSFLAIFPSVRLAGVRNARHWVHFDNKPEFVSLVRDFMA